ncbi:IGF-like family receptor 1 isoform X2 [Clupea harengus]|uniref:IGF-like family receptor 1 isoform X2 n=1 Tax=Clupea harengus TaxID=7950 RepID=A0A6P8GC89_CLUHA|nr:IGF-like family receptor 1 isoform X2 [Clupea harengus]
MAHSSKCKFNLTTRWDSYRNACVSCLERYPIKPGKEFSANCGFSDDGGRHEWEYKYCSSGTYNNGSFLRCKYCTSCSPVSANCTPTADTQCCLNVEHTTGMCKDGVTVVLTTAGQTTFGQTTFGRNPINHHESVLWIIPVILVSAILFYILRRRNIRFWCTKGMENHRKSPCSSKTGTETQHDTLVPCVTTSFDDIIAPGLQAAPLQLLLNNLDVLEELLILLDPDVKGLRSTRHLAARCDFSSTWINYAYFRRDSKSPLVAMLEAVATRSPEWTVGQLAWLLHDIDRHDAVNVLTKLHQPQEQV